jgi:hypothetical protein
MTVVITNRPTTLTAYHNYNLRNNGWPAESRNSSDINGEFTPVVNDPVAYTNTSLSFYPSLADNFISAKATGVISAANLGAFSPWELQKFNYGNTPAPKGRYILNAFNRNRTTASGIPGLYEADRDLDSERCSSIEFYAGRIWYLKPNGEVLFSQILSDITRADKCYQEADPTAEDINDITDADGGVIRIRDIGEGIKLVANQDAIFVLARNGVWAISGTDTSGFTATNFQIRKLTNAGVESVKSVVLADRNIFYWAKSGIYVITADQVTGLPSAQNLTEQTIQTKYLAIPENARKLANGIYDSENRRILWMYTNSSGFDGVNWRFRFSDILVFDTALGAFYDWSVPAGRLADGTPTHIAGAVTTDSLGVTVSGEDDERLTEVSLKYFVIDEDSTDNFVYSWAEDRDLAFTDFATSTGTEFDSTIETGNDILGDPTVGKFGNYLHAFFERTETAFDANGDLTNPSGCNFRIKWDWSDDEVSGKWSALQPAYYFKRPYLNDTSVDFTYGYEIIHTKTRVRGNGKAMRIRFESESGKDFKLLGWSIPYSGVQQ